MLLVGFSRNKTLSPGALMGDSCFVQERVAPESRLEADDSTGIELSLVG